LLLGNLLVITVVSYFGAKFHRPKIIGAGVLLMAIGTLIMALPHFIMDRWVMFMGQWQIRMSAMKNRNKSFVSP